MLDSILEEPGVARLALNPSIKGLWKPKHTGKSLAFFGKAEGCLSWKQQGE